MKKATKNTVNRKIRAGRVWIKPKLTEEQKDRIAEDLALFFYEHWLKH